MSRRRRNHRHRSLGELTSHSRSARVVEIRREIEDSQRGRWGQCLGEHRDGQVCKFCTRWEVSGLFLETGGEQTRLINEALVQMPGWNFGMIRVSLDFRS